MRQKLLATLTALVLGAGSAALGQPSQLWENWGVYQIPPPQDNIDALTVINHAGASINFSGDYLFNTYDTLNFTNQGLIVGDPGFIIETIPTGTGSARMAANFVNQASGTSTNNGMINCSGAFSFVITPFLPVGNLTGNSKFVAAATNISNSGSINMDASSLIQLIGDNIDLSRGALTMNNTFFGLGLTGFFSAGQLDGYWGVGTAANPFTANSAAPLLFPPNLTVGVSPLHLVTFRSPYLQGYTQIALNNPVAYLNDSGIIGSNRTVQAVLIMNTNSAFLNSIFFTPFEIAVQWQWASTNWPTGTVSTNNYLYVADDFGEITNLQVALNGVAGVKGTFMPVNFSWFFGAPFSTFGAAPPVTLPFNVFGTGAVTNQYAAYQAIFAASTELPTDVAGGNATNLAGRIEVSANKTLNLNQARISSLNYLLLSGTNHFLGSDHAVIGSPTTDMYLRTTNGAMAITNLVAPFLNHLQGFCDLYSARWTNVNAAGITNTFHVLLVDSEFAPVTTPIVQTLKLTVTNNVGAQNDLRISDILNITTNVTFSADSLTITTNIGDPFTHAGALNFLNPNILWSTASLNLKYLTNYGSILTFNSVYFGGSHMQLPYNTNLVNVPYGALVNRGGITNQASLVWASDFEDSGSWDNGQGSFVLQQATNCIITNAVLLAGGDVDLYAASMFLSNVLVLSSSALTLSPTNLLDDGSALTASADYITNKNFWSFGGSINLLSLSPQCSLLGTTITNFAPDFALTHSVWAGADRSTSPGGFANNGAIGHLILDGNTNCGFEFDAVGGANALYVDMLDLRDFVATNVDRFGNFSSIACAPNMKVYFGQALANGVSIAEKLPVVNNGRFIWVSNYNTGFFSSTNVVYPDGSTNRLNTALVTSCDIDSNGNGIPNCMDPAPIPILTPANLALSVAITNLPTPAALVSWTAFPYTTNYLYSSTLPHGTNWQLVTNFLFSGPLPNRVTVTDLIKTNVPRFYRVRAGMP